MSINVDRVRLITGLLLLLPLAPLITTLRPELIEAMGSAWKAAWEAAGRPKIPDIDLRYKDVGYAVLD